MIVTVLLNRLFIEFFGMVVYESELNNSIGAT